MAKYYAQCIERRAADSLCTEHSIWRFRARATPHRTAAYLHTPHWTRVCTRTYILLTASLANVCNRECKLHATHTAHTITGAGAGEGASTDRIRVNFKRKEFLGAGNAAESKLAVRDGGRHHQQVVRHLHLTWNPGEGAKDTRSIYLTPYKT